jgi:hypothetical protein
MLFEDLAIENKSQLEIVEQIIKRLDACILTLRAEYDDTVAGLDNYNIGQVEQASDIMVALQIIAGKYKRSQYVKTQAKGARE